MSVGGLTLDPVTKTPIVILKDTDNKLNLPIWIGLLEATAMATEIEGIKMNMLGTKVAVILQLVIYARPSDAIALALRTKSPIFVAKAVLEASSVLQQNEEGKEAAVENVSNVSKEKWAEILEKMTPDDFKYKQ
jgi:bifunctional DNase/RNase